MQPAPQPKHPVASALTARLVEVHRYQGDSNDCGPYCAAMVAAALTGGEVDSDALALALNRPRRGGVWGLLPLVRRIPGFATFPWGLVDALRALGLRARWRRGVTEAELRGWLGAGLGVIVVIGGWRWREGRGPWAHYLVLVAHDPLQGWGFSDPGRPGREVHWMDHQKFERQWSAMGRLAVVAGGGDGGGGGTSPIRMPA